MAYQTVRKTFWTNDGINYDLQYDTATSQVQLIQQNAPSGTSPVFYDGSFSNSLNIPQSTQLSLFQDIKTEIYRVYQSNGGAARGLRVAQWALPTNTSGPGQNSSNPSQNPTSGTNTGTGLGGLINTALRPASAIAGVAVNNEKLWFSANASKLFKVPMKYPFDLASNKQDTMVITAHRYIPPNIDLLAQDNFGSIISEGLLRNRDSLEEVLGQVTFPMPLGVQDTKSMNWGQGDTINPFSAAVGSKFANNSLSAAGGAALGGTLGALLGNYLKIGPGAVGGAKFGAQTQLYAEGLAAASGSAQGQALIGAGLVDKITQLLGFGVPAETILSRGAGVVSNDNMELLFNGPSLRQFSCAYRLTARSRREAEEIRKIIRFFKQVSSPKKVGGAAGNRSVFLGTPDVFKIRFLTSGGTEIEGVSRFKTCALTQVTTNYAPDNNWLAYDGGQPVSTTLSLTFMELEPVYENDYQSNITTGRSDLRPVTDSSVGY